MESDNVLFIFLTLTKNVFYVLRDGLIYYFIKKKKPFIMKQKRKAHIASHYSYYTTSILFIQN